MASKGRRHAVRRWVADGLRSAAEALGAPSSRPDDVVDLGDLDEVDITVDAFTVVHKMGIGWDFAFVDLRHGPMEERLPGAVQIPLSSLAKRAHEVPSDVTVVVYADDEAAGVRGAMVLRTVGHEDAWGLGGGLPAWRREGGELERP